LTAVRDIIARLHPACFSLVMATGIVSLAAWILEMRVLAWALFGVNVAAYAVLWLLTLVRLVRRRKAFWADLADHHRSVGFFTTVAGTCVLGNQWLLIAQMPRVATAFWILGIVLWAVLTYTIFTALTIKREKPGLGEGLNGAWLLAVVAAQSVAVLGGLLAPSFQDGQAATLFFSLTMWLGGGMLYIWIIALVFYRYMFFTLEPAHLTPPYWINMGAMAISTLAGAVLTGAARHSSLLSELLPFLKGLTLLFWATATWWIPMLLILGVWRHVYRRFPLKYDVAYWGAVFPLGMYTVASYRLGAAIAVSFLQELASWFVYAALAAWSLTAFGLVLSFVQIWRAPQAPQHGSQGSPR
jgi:tellurite resistance protein TehA-like permease